MHRPPSKQVFSTHLSQALPAMSFSSFVELAIHTETNAEMPEDLGAKSLRGLIFYDVPRGIAVLGGFLTIFFFIKSLVNNS